MLMFPIFVWLLQENSTNKQQKRKRKILYIAHVIGIANEYIICPVINRDFNQDKHALLIKCKLKQDQLSYVTL
jgi:hypothetical protein